MKRLIFLCLAPLLLAAASHARGGIIEDIQARLDRIELRLAAGDIPPTVPPVVTPTQPSAPASGGPLVLRRGSDYAEVRVSTVGRAAAFQVVLEVDARIAVEPIRGGGRPILLQLYINGFYAGNGPEFIVPTGTYTFVLSGGSQIPGAEQSVAARPR